MGEGRRAGALDGIEAAPLPLLRTGVGELAEGRRLCGLGLAVGEAAGDFWAETRRDKDVLALRGDDVEDSPALVGTAAKCVRERSVGKSSALGAGLG